MSLFTNIPHPKYPEYYTVCRETGVHFYKKARIREYTGNYFLEEFKNQYKKTYYEDEPNLRILAGKRLDILEGFAPGKNGMHLLEIGCAAGFFLSEAALRGYKVEGVEISSKEVEYARNNLGLNVRNENFLSLDWEHQFDIICAFFVIEHFENQELVINKIFSLLKTGGFLFLAVPSLYGPTFHTNPQEWFRTHPSDHFVDYSPVSLRNLFSKFNTEILYNKPMSYHPSRDRGWRGMLPIKYLYKVIADFTCYGDTIQVLAKKK